MLAHAQAVLIDAFDRDAELSAQLWKEFDDVRVGVYGSLDGALGRLIALLDGL